MSNQLQARRMNGTSMPSKTMNDISNLMKMAVVVLLLAAIPVVYHIPSGVPYGTYHTRQRFAYHDFTTEHLSPNLDSFVFMGNNRISNKSESILKIETANAFDPSMKILSRILNVLMGNNNVIKATLLKKANLNHIRLSSHLEWLEQKGLIEYVVIDNKAHITLTESGRAFAKPLVSIAV